MRWLLLALILGGCVTQTAYLCAGVQDRVGKQYIYCEPVTKQEVAK